MVKRTAWLKLIEESWRRKSVIWLSGVRRVGKTVLSRTLPRVEYFDCELPRVRRMMDDPEAFLKRLRRKRIILDEIHRLTNPSQLLKIAADHFPDVHVLATGSSTLGASRKFRDTLTGRKAEIWLTPITVADMKSFHKLDTAHRMINGGLPPFFLERAIEERAFQEWMDTYWARDIAELFRLQRRSSFQKFAELLMIHSGGMFEASRYARECEVNRMTIMNYLGVLEDTHVAHVLRPFSSRRAIEIVAAPKVYAFDTGFVSYHRGWYKVGSGNAGFLWEHLVLNEIHAHLQSRRVCYWRDKHGNEVDFVIPLRGRWPIGIECKWSSREFNPRGLLAFSNAYPSAKLAVVASDLDDPITRVYHGKQVTFVGLKHFPPCVLP